MFSQMIKLGALFSIPFLAFYGSQPGNSYMYWLLGALTLVFGLTSAYVGVGLRSISSDPERMKNPKTILIILDSVQNLNYGSVNIQLPLAIFSLTAVFSAFNGFTTPAVMLTILSLTWFFMAYSARRAFFNLMSK